MAVLHDGDPVGDGEGFLLIVGDVDGGDAQTPLQLLDDGAHLHSQLGVQITQRLVHQQNTWLDNKSSGQSHTLLLTAGQFVGLPVCQMGDLHQFQRLVNLGFDLLGGHLPRLETVGYVLPDGQVGEDGVVLEDHANVALVGGNIVDPLFAKVKIAALDGVKTGDHPQKRGFAAAGGAKKGKEFALLNVQRNAVQRGEIAVALYGVLNNDLIAHVVSSRMCRYVARGSKVCRSIRHSFQPQAIHRKEAPWRVPPAVKHKLRN